MPGATTAPVSSDPLSRPAGGAPEVHALFLAWSAEEPWRIGETAVLAKGVRQVLGRGEETTDEPRVRFHQLRPATFAEGPPLAGAGLSRRQLVLTLGDDGLAVESVGQCPLTVNRSPCKRALLKPGDTLQLRRQLV